MEIFRLSGHAAARPGAQRVKLQLDRLRRLSLPEKATTCALIGEHRLFAGALADGELANGQAQVSDHARRVFAQASRLQRIHPNYFTA